MTWDGHEGILPGKVPRKGRYLGIHRLLHPGVNNQLSGTQFEHASMWTADVPKTHASTMNDINYLIDTLGVLWSRSWFLSFIRYTWLYAPTHTLKWWTFLLLQAFHQSELSLNKWLEFYNICDNLNEIFTDTHNVEVVSISTATRLQPIRIESTTAWSHPVAERMPEKGWLVLYSGQANSREYN